VPARSYLYCASGEFSPDAGIDAGTTGHLWKWAPGTSPDEVAALPVVPLTLAVSPDGNWLYMTEGNNLAAYFIGGPAATAPMRTAAIAGGGAVYDIVATPDGRVVYASVPTANRLLIIDANSFSLITQRTDLENPGPLYFSPRP
jgi:DNA-binding beta-propeller fold protein YncE